MTGRYLIYTPIESARDERRFDKAWRRFAELCRVACIGTGSPMTCN